ncbi:MAG: hypothetical protein WCL44_11920 [bacterium]
MCSFQGKWPPGRQCSYRVEVREETATKAPAQSGRYAGGAAATATSVVELVWQTIEAGFSLRDEPSDGNRMADLVIVSATVEREQRIANAAPRMVRRKLAGVTGVGVAYSMDSRGVVRRTDGAEEFMRRVIRYGGPTANETFAAVFNEDFLEQMRITGWKHLPEGPAVPGQAWTATDKIEFPGIGRILVRQRHRFEKWERRDNRMYARISWWGAVGSVVETAAADDVLPDNVQKVESVGSCLFCPLLGMIVEWSENLSVATVLEIGGRPAGAGEITQEIHRRTEVKLAGPVVDSRAASGRLLADKNVSVIKKRPGGKTEGSDEKNKVKPAGKAPSRTGGRR